MSNIYAQDLLSIRPARGEDATALLPGRLSAECDTLIQGFFSIFSFMAYDTTPHLALPCRWSAFVCIPDGPQSFVSKAIGKGPISIRHLEDGAAHVAGSPATCVNIALNHLAADCDFVISGPNVGHNAGRQGLPLRECSQLPACIAPAQVSMHGSRTGLLQGFATLF